MWLTEMPGEKDFEYGGYTHMSGGRVEGHQPWGASGPTAEERLRQDGANLYGNSLVSKGLKARTMANQFFISGPHRLGKVRPVAPPDKIKDEPDYPPGDGVPQWKLVRPLWWVSAAFVPPGGIFTGQIT